jgi:succinyl-CoA synthetase beta subunit
MKIHEYQAKEMLREFEVPVPRGKIAFNVEQADRIAAELGTLPVLIKAQIHAGERGKSGGVKLAKTSEKVKQFSSQILGMTLVNRQTGPEGKVVKKVLVEEALAIEKELYLSIFADRDTAKIVFIASEAGGMDIEEVAAKTPEKIIKVYVNPLIGLKGYHANGLAFGLNLTASLIKQFTGMVSRLFRLFTAYDCSLVEINPLGVTKDSRLVALDAKINFDDNALYRHKDTLVYRDLDEEDPLEVEAAKYGLNYIKMPGGNIGNMVNGAGLAMATMDVIEQAGAAPANFLDVGGGASAEQVENGFRIILSDPAVKGVLINVFGGILRCDTLAHGIVEAAKKIKIGVPVVIRMEGTNFEEGRRILAESGLNLITASDITDAARRIAAIAKG